jgi:hypothetical protein
MWSAMHGMADHPRVARWLSGRRDSNSRPPAPKGHSGFAGGHRRAGWTARTSRFGVPQGALLGPHTRVGASLVRPGPRGSGRPDSRCLCVRKPHPVTSARPTRGRSVGRYNSPAPAPAPAPARWERGASGDRRSGAIRRATTATVGAEVWGQRSRVSAGRVDLEVVGRPLEWRVAVGAVRFLPLELPRWLSAHVCSIAPAWLERPANPPRVPSMCGSGRHPQSAGRSRTGTAAVHGYDLHWPTGSHPPRTMPEGFDRASTGHICAGRGSLRAALGECEEAAKVVATSPGLSPGLSGRPAESRPPQLPPSPGAATRL